MKTELRSTCKQKTDKSNCLSTKQANKTHQAVPDPNHGIKQDIIPSIPDDSEFGKRSHSTSKLEVED